MAHEKEQKKMALESPFGSGTATGMTNIKPIESMVPKQPTQLFNNNAKAILYLVRPTGARKLTDQAHRANLFQFSNQFANKAAEVIDRSVLQNASSRALIDLTHTPDALKSIIPTSRPDTIVQTSMLSDNWQFVLIILENGGGTVSPLMKQRVIVTGYCLEEPINPMSLSNPKPTINPNATLVFTHRTVVGETMTQGHDGFHVRDYRTHMDVHCVDNTQIKPLVQHQEMHLLDPKTCWDTYTYTEGANSFSLPGVTSSLDNQNGPIALTTTLDNPKSTLKDILTVVHNAHENLQMESRMGSAQNTSVLHPNATKETLHSMVASNFENKYTMYNSGGPTENEVWHMRKLMSMYPGIDIQPIGLEKAYSFAAADQVAQTAENTFSALLCAVVPSVMVDLGLNTIAFTATVRQVSVINERCFWNVSHREAFMPLPDKELNIRAKGVMTALINGVFETIRLTRGDFTVSASFTLSGRSHVLLNFLSNSMPNQTPYEVPTNLSGLLTPTFGTAACHGQNAQSLQNLMGVLLGDQSVENTIGHVTNQGILGQQQQPITPGSLLGNTAPLPQQPNNTQHGGGLSSPFQNAGINPQPNSGLSSPFGVGGINLLNK